MKRNSLYRPCMLSLLLAFLAICTPVLAETAAPFTVVLLPDTQNYSEKYPETYKSQTEWIKEEADAKNIKFAIHLGDLVQNVAQEKEWQAADRAHAVLDGLVPYSVSPGNHDLDYEGERLTRNTSMFHKYFPPARFEKEAWYGGHRGETNAANYCFFEADDLKFMVLSLPFAPSDAMIAWATAVLEQYPEHRVILATHYYMRPEGRSKDRKPYGLDGADGEMLWRKLVRKQEQIFMVVSGHVLGVHHQISTNDAGKPVIEILSDYQGEDNGGNGWLQFLQFVPEKNEIEVVAYSTTLKKTDTRANHSYTVPYAMSEK